MWMLAFCGNIISSNIIRLARLAHKLLSNSLECCKLLVKQREKQTNKIDVARFRESVRTRVLNRAKVFLPVCRQLAVRHKLGRYRALLLRFSDFSISHLCSSITARYRAHRMLRSRRGKIAAFYVTSFFFFLFCMTEMFSVAFFFFDRSRNSLAGC